MIDVSYNPDEPGVGVPPYTFRICSLFTRSFSISLVCLNLGIGYAPYDWSVRVCPVPIINL